MNETPRNKVQKKVVSKKRSWKGGGKKSHNAVRNQRLGFEARKETDGYTKRERVYKVSERERERERGEWGQCGWVRGWREEVLRRDNVQ
jgi:hypothetical protein